MESNQIAQLRHLLSLGFSDEEIALMFAEERRSQGEDDLAAQHEEWQAHGESREFFSDFGKVNDAGERSF